MHPVQRGSRVRARVAAARVLTGSAMLLVLLTLGLPNRLSELGPAAFVRLPVEALVYVAVILLLPSRLGHLRVLLAVLAGLALALTGILKLLDMGFLHTLDRPFDALVDWRYTGSLVDLVRDSFGEGLGTALLALAALTGVALLVLVPLSVLRLTRVASRHRGTTVRVLAGLASLWLVLAVLDVRGGAGGLASRQTAGYVYDQVSRIPGELRDQREFAQAADEDPLTEVAKTELLTRLRGKDVLIVFVESYGRSALEGTSFAGGVKAVLAEGERRLEKAGFGSRSAFLTSPTYGGVSWLAHATLQSGLWVDSQQKYDALMTSSRLTLTRAFGRAGWRTVDVVPANTRDWPEGAFYHFDHIYDSRNVGYKGPRFGYPTMPDQFTLEAFHRLELAPERRRPVMAEIDLISSHAPWSRTPLLIDQSEVGDGSVYEGMPDKLPSEADIWPSPTRVRAAYGKAIEYSLEALFTFMTSYADDDTVVVFLGDHQPASIVTGEGASHDVPVTVVARDEAVLGPFSGWGWNEGVRPRPDAPVWPMDSFRDRFLDAFGSGGRATLHRAAAVP